MAGVGSRSPGGPQDLPHPTPLCLYTFITPNGVSVQGHVSLERWCKSSFPGTDLLLSRQPGLLSRSAFCLRGGAKAAFKGLTFCFPGNQVCFLQGKLSPGNLKLDSLLSESDRCGLWLKIYFVYFVYVLQQLLNYLWMCSGCVLGCMLG